MAEQRIRRLRHLATVLRDQLRREGIKVRRKHFFWVQQRSRLGQMKHLIKGVVNMTERDRGLGVVVMHQRQKESARCGCFRRRTLQDLDLVPL